MKVKISAIVPAYNEEDRIRDVLEVITTSPLINEVICVNDGSSDDTVAVIKEFHASVQLINLHRNYGKGFAMAAGIKKAKGDILLFIDADLVNLTHEHIATLVEPLLKQTSKVSLGVRSSEKLNYYLPKRFNISGERAYYRLDLIAHIERLRKSRYGAEVFLNSLFSRKQTTRVILEGLYNPQKNTKRGLHNGIKEYVKEGIEITVQLSKIEGQRLDKTGIVKKTKKYANPRNINNIYEVEIVRKYLSQQVDYIQKIWNNLP